MKTLKYNDKKYKMIDSYNYEKSSREVKYSEVTIDFTDLTSSDLPKKYQECQIVDENDNILFTGYVSDFAISDMHLERDVSRTLSIELISPMALATVRTVILKGTYPLKEAINKIIWPLLDDGFILKELNVSNQNVTVNYVLTTVEESLNRLSNSNNFWWYIDENKNIFINDITYQFSKESVMVYDDKPPHGLYKIEPTIEVEDYCNVINIKNVRVYSASISYGTTKLNPIITEQKVSDGDAIMFSQPIDIALKNVKKSYEELKMSLSAYDIGEYPPAIYFEATTSAGSTKVFYIRLKDDKLDISNNIKTSEDDDDDEKDFELVKDSFFSSLVTGFKYNGTSKLTITKFMSISCLKWTNIRFFDNIEIEKQKGIVSKTGQIEKIIDLNEQWKLMSEVTTTARSYLDANSGGASSVKLYFDEKKKINIGDIVEIDKPKFLLDNSRYICTDISVTYANDECQDYVYELRNKNYLTNYIDLFRASEEESSNEKVETFVISNYVEEAMKETHEVI